MAALPGAEVVVDVLAPAAWPAMYPPLAGVLDRARPGALGPPVASPGDRLLVAMGEGIAGRPSAKVRRRLALTWQEPGARASLRSSLAARPGVLRAAVAALRVRLLGDPLPTGPGGPPGILVALSGMDGAGKSTAALDLCEAFTASGRPAVVWWTRLAGDLRVLDAAARMFRRLLRRAPAGRGGASTSDAAPPEAGVVDRVWVVAVAASSVLAAWRAARLRRRGLTVVCDRWLVDALVDLRVRYGHHPVAEAVLRRGFPAADMAALLTVDAVTAAARKPGDQTAATLEAMEALYAELSGVLPRIDARAGRGSVARILRRSAGLGHAAAQEVEDHPGVVGPQP